MPCEQNYTNSTTLSLHSEFTDMHLYKIINIIKKSSMVLFIIHINMQMMTQTSMHYTAIHMKNTFFNLQTTLDEYVRPINILLVVLITVRIFNSTSSAQHKKRKIVNSYQEQAYTYCTVLHLSIRTARTAKIA